MTETSKMRVITAPQNLLVQCAPLLMNECNLDGLDMNHLQGGSLTRYLPYLFRAVRDGMIYEAVRTAVVNAGEIVDSVSEAIDNIGSSYATDNPTWDESYYSRSKYGGFKRG